MFLLIRTEFPAAEGVGGGVTGQGGGGVCVARATDKVQDKFRG